jgi:hypothetical protein
MTLSLFYRPCKNTTAEYYTNDGNPQYQSNEGHKQMSLTTAKGLFSKKHSLLSSVILKQAEVEASKLNKPKSPSK